MEWIVLYFIIGIIFTLGAMIGSPVNDTPEDFFSGKRDPKHIKEGESEFSDMPWWGLALICAAFWPLALIGGFVNMVKERIEFKEKKKQEALRKIINEELGKGNWL